MKLTKTILLFLPAALLLITNATAQLLPPADIAHPKPDSWPTFNGDYSGRRYSPLKQINTDTVKGLTLAWISRVNMTSPPTFSGGTGAVAQGATANNRGTPLLVDGVLYMTEPNAMFALLTRARAVKYGTTRGREFPRNRWAIAARESTATGSISKLRTAT